QLKQIILDFEPRILSDSLNVKVTVSEEEMSNNALVFEIEGDLWGQPLPQHLFLKTVIDLNSSHVVIEDMNG
nr:GPW/gp25 family protein [Pseudomonadales bacterium]